MSDELIGRGESPPPTPTSATLKDCDTVPAAQNFTVRPSTRQLADTLRHHAASGSSSLDSHDDHDSTIPQTSPSAEPSARTRFDSNAGNTTPTKSPTASHDTGSTATSFIGPFGKISNPSPVRPPRHLCMRHKRTADEGTNLELGRVSNNLPSSAGLVAPDGPFTNSNFFPCCSNVYPFSLYCTPQSR